ncbi:MAG: P-loop NTPase fold protein [Gemmatimonadaceae bacterium]|jgi:predicted KAP-like P-loop ATPase
MTKASREQEPDYFVSDGPITGKAEDRIGRSIFAAQLAMALRGWRGDGSLVVSLYGKWGTGKSSVKNLVVEELKSSAHDRVEIVELNVWEFANRTRITSTFLDQLGLALGRGAVESSQPGAQVAKQLKKYEAYLASTHDLADFVQGNGASIGALLSGLLVMIGMNIVPSAVISTVGVIGAAASLLTKKSAKLAGSIANVVSAGGDRTKTLKEAKQAVQDAITNLKKPVLVVLDELDRLTPTETVEVLQLLKTNLDFKGVLFFVLCDRGITESHITTALHVPGREYLEKIVQVGFTMPAMNQAQVNAVLFEKLDAAISQFGLESRFDDGRWQNLYTKALQPYFANLRDVNRFASTLSFYAANFQTATGSEVNPVDLIGLEVLRMFEPELYRRLPRIKHILTGSRLSSDRQEESALVAKEINDVLDRVSEASRSDAREVLIQLFPKVAHHLGGMGYAAEYDDQWFRDGRVCAKDVFDRYFGFAVPAGDISQATLDRILASTANPTALRAEFVALADNQMLEVALDRLDAYKEKFPPEHSVSLLTVLFDVGELLPSQKEVSMSLFGPSVSAVRIIHWHLKSERDPHRRLEVLKEAISASIGFRLSSDYVASQRQRLEHPEGGSSENALFDQTAVKELEQLCISKIRAAAEDGRLARSPDFAEILFDWRRFGDEAASQEYCGRLARTPEGALQLVVAFEQVVTSHSLGEHAPRYRWYIRLSNVAQFVDPEVVAVSLQRLDRASLTKEERRALGCFERALKRRRTGKAETERGLDADADEDELAP